MNVFYTLVACAPEVLRNIDASLPAYGSNMIDVDVIKVTVRVENIPKVRQMDL